MKKDRGPKPSLCTCALHTCAALSLIALASCSGRGDRTNTPDADENANDVTASESVANDMATNVGTTATATTYKMYIECSSSMDGYFNSDNGVRGTRQCLYNMAQALGCTDLAFVNNSIIPADGNTCGELSKMSLADFKAYGNRGSRSSSDLGNVIRQVVEVTPASGTVSLLVSDFIFSPNKNTASTSLGPEAAKSEIKELFAGKGLSVAVMKVLADFDGILYTGHYEKKGKEWKEVSYQTAQKRPVYIWAIGGAAEINALINRKDFNDFKFIDYMALSPCGQSVDYHLERSRQYDLDRNDNRHAKDAKCGGRGATLDLIVNADLGNIVATDTYKSDPENYETSDPNFNVGRVEPIGNGRYRITVSSMNVRAGKLNVMLKSQLPEWVKESSMRQDDWDPRDEGNEERTFGFAPLVEGVADAMKTTDDNYTTITIRIN